MANIMIIDSSPFINSLISKDLLDDGHSVNCFEDADDAIDKIPLCGPDIVLFDLYFQGFENWNILHNMKKKCPDLPVIIVTAYNNFLKDPRLAEADGYVIKEISTDKLKRRIREVLVCKGY